MKKIYVLILATVFIINVLNVKTANAQVLNEGFEGTTFPPIGWTKTITNPTPTYQWKQSTTIGYSSTKSAMVEYDPNFASQNEWFISPTLNLTSLTNASLNFRWRMSYYWGVNPYNNYDFKVNVSTDGGATWAIIWTEDSVGVFASNIFNQTIISLTAYANSTNFKVAFQYKGSDGAALYLDNVVIENLPNNRIEFNEIEEGFAALTPCAYSGYTQIPSGQTYTVDFLADIINTGALAQTNVKLISRELTTGVSKFCPASILYMYPFEHDTLEIDSINTIGGSVGTYKYTLDAVSDSIPSNLYKDTIIVTVNNNINGMYSRDNNYYDGSYLWNGMAIASVNAFQMANLVEVSTATPIFAKSISVVLANGTSLNAPIKAILYRGWGQTKTVIAESDYHFVMSNEIATSIGSNPPSIELLFTDYSASALEKDSAYFVTLQAFGGADTVKVAVGTNKTPQPDYTIYIYDIDNTWYYFPKGTAPPMIRLNTTSVSTLPYPAGTITGLTTVCQGQANVTYTVPPITNASTYLWTLPNGASGTSTTNSITVSYGTAAITSLIYVKGYNSSGYGASSVIIITVNALLTNPGTISGNTNVIPGQQNVIYTVPSVANAISYVWTLPNGASGTDTTNNIVVNYSTSAVTGYITVYAVNSCGNSASSSVLVTVNSVVPNCSAQFAMVADTAVLHHYYVENNASGVPPLKYVWSWGDGSSDTVAYPNHTFSTSGYYAICLTITDSTGCTNTYCDSTLLQKSSDYVISVSVIPHGTLGINTNELSNQIKVYPNPTKDNLTIETNSTKE
ncbi:MAG: PKD domain-containing protein, partial [Bacteroidota bacterium]